MRKEKRTKKKNDSVGRVFDPTVPSKNPGVTLSKAKDLYINSEMLRSAQQDKNGL